MSGTAVLDQQQTTTETTVEQPQPLVVSQSTFSAPINTSVSIEPTSETVLSQENQNTIDTELQENEAQPFTLPNFDQPTTTETVQTTQETSNNNQPQTTQGNNWQDVIKNVDKKEVLKAIGLDEFEIEFHEFRQSGNDPYKYLEAKLTNWDNVPDTDIVKSELKKQYPFYSNEELERIINKKYDINSDDEDERTDGLLLLKADAHTKREELKKQQKDFVIPTVATKQEAENANVLEQQKIQHEQQQAAMQEFQKMVNEHEATKSLFETKRVSVNLGEGVKPFNFPIDNPETLMSIAFGKNWVRAVAANPQEADESKLIPDIAKLQKLAYIASNPNYEKDIFNYGRSQGKKELVSEGQNAIRPLGQQPTEVKQTIQDAIKSARVSTFGGS